MIYKMKVRHDAFSFSLAGMSTMASVIAPTIIASDRLSKTMDDRIGSACTVPPPCKGGGEPRPSWIRRAGSRFAWSDNG